MRFRNSLHLLIDNFGTVYKMLLYKFVVILITVSIALSFVIPNMSYIFDSAEYAGFLNTLTEFVKALTSGNVEYLAGFQEEISSSVSALGALVTSEISHVVITVIAVIFTYILNRFLDTIGNYSFGSMLNDKMNSYAEISFLASITKNLGSASLYAICYVLLTLAYNILIVVLCYLVFFMLLSFMPFILTLFFSATLLMCAEALRLTFMSGWMPAMIEGKKTLRQAFKYSFTVKLTQMGRVFSNYLVSVYLIMIINVICAVCTLFSSLLLTYPASFLFLLCMQFVNYYTVEGKKYFVNYYKIADNRDKGEKSRFIDEKDIKEEKF